MVNMITNMNPFYLDSYADSYAVKFKHHFVCLYKTWDYAMQGVFVINRFGIKPVPYSGLKLIVKTAKLKCYLL